MYFQAIGRFFGLNSAIISRQACLAEQPFMLIASNNCYQRKKRMGRPLGPIQIPRTKPENAPGTTRLASTPTWDRDLRRYFAPYSQKSGLSKD
jgi:hypothetical protein